MSRMKVKDAYCLHMGMFKNNEAYHFLASHAHAWQCLDFKDQT